MFSSLNDFELLTKPLGAYLIEAGLLTDAQVQVILADQLSTDMKFGEIAAIRGWVKQQTVDYLMDKVVLPERQRQTQPAEIAQQAPAVTVTRPFPDPRFAEPVRPQRPAASAPQRSIPKPPPRTVPKPAPSRPVPTPSPRLEPIHNIDTEEFEWLG